jgi:hypothetical protein
MRGLAWHVWILLLVMGQVKLSGQGTLQFNKAMILTSDSGQKTVPANKVWKVESYSYNFNHWYNGYSNWGNVNWSNGTQNPCTGANSGTSNVNFYSQSQCPQANANLFINGNRINGGALPAFPIWLPSGVVLEIFSNPSFNTVSFSVPANTPVRDNNTGAYLCGPINVTAGPVPNSPVVSILEFNIIP